VGVLDELALEFDNFDSYFNIFEHINFKALQKIPSKAERNHGYPVTEKFLDIVMKLFQKNVIKYPRFLSKFIGYV